MRHAGANDGLQQCTGLDRVVLVVAQRIGHGIGNDNRSGEMDDGLDPVIANDAAHEILVGNVADDEICFQGNGPVESRRQTVEHDDVLAGIEKGPDHVAADISGTTRHKHTHRITRYARLTLAAIVAYSP